MTQLNLADCINDVCPWSGKPVSPNALTIYKGLVVGFCNPGCRDKFLNAIVAFEAAIHGQAALNAERTIRDIVALEAIGNQAA